jgi:hypothetical protein
VRRNRVWTTQILCESPSCVPVVFLAAETFRIRLEPNSFKYNVQDLLNDGQTENSIPIPVSLWGRVLGKAQLEVIHIARILVAIGMVLVIRWRRSTLTSRASVGRLILQTIVADIASLFATLLFLAARRLLVGFRR